MNQNDKNTAIENSTDNMPSKKNVFSKSLNEQDNQRNKIIIGLMEKYQISKEDAEKILKKIEDDNKNNYIPQKVTQPKTTPKEQQQTQPKTTPKEQQQTQPKTTPKEQQQTQPKTTPKEQDVEEIMTDLIEDYNQKISIDVQHLDLTFDVETDKIDTIKEFFIRTIKQDKPKKIKIHALKDISFKIAKGEKVGIIGYNGAGKSTLLNVICGIYPTDSGYVKTNGNISPLLGLGAGFDQNYSGRKNIILNGAVLGYDKEFLENKMDEIIEFSELEDFIDIPIKNYSSGMLAKLAFSIATTVEPDILVIDEVLGVGDVNFAKKSRDKIKYLMDGGTTVLLVSHSIPQIKELCDKAIWIDKGQLREMGEVNKVCDHYLKDAEKASKEQLKNIKLK